MSEIDNQTLNGRDEELMFDPTQLRVLAIDANAVSLIYLVTVLKKCRYQVTSTTKADEALEILRSGKEKIDIVISDVVRLDIDGFKLLDLLREIDVPVILVSAEESQNSIMKGIEHGAQDYLIKPVRVQEMRNIWQHVVRKRLQHSVEKSSIINPESIIPAQEIEPINPELLVHSQEIEQIVVTGKGEVENSYSESDNEDNNENKADNLSSQKKPRLKWTNELHCKFMKAVEELGDVIHPKKILKLMNEPGLSRDQVASHLQKYRRKKKDEEEKENQMRAETANKALTGMQSGLYSSINNQVHLQHQQQLNTAQQFLYPPQQLMMPNVVAPPQFRELNFTPAFLSTMKFPDEYMASSSLQPSYNNHCYALALPNSYPFISHCPNPHQMPILAQEEPDMTLLNQQSIAQEGHYPLDGGYSSLDNVYPLPLAVHCPEQTNPILENNSTSSCDDLTELIQQFSNDQPPQL